MDERLKRIASSSYTIPVGVGVAAFAAGLGVGYLVSRRRQVVVVVPEVEEEPYSQLEFDLSTPNVVPIFQPKENVSMEDHPSVIREEKIIVPAPSEEPIEPVTVRVFSEIEDDWDWESEHASRVEGEPHVIHKEEFYADEMDYTQSTLCYYAGDDILCDEDDVPIASYESVTGELKFGHGSGDANVVHIRNPITEAEYEVLKYDAHYSVEILGLEIEEAYEAKELRHSLYKFRSDD